MLTEIADIAYYAVKLLHQVAWMANLAPETALRLAIAKYTLRAAPGNPKNDAAERAACRAVLLDD